MLLQFPDHKNLFCCIECEMSQGEFKEHECNACHSFFCDHLVVYSGSAVIICFICQGTAHDEGEWPDWSYSMVPRRRDLSKAGQ